MWLQWFAAGGFEGWFFDEGWFSGLLAGLRALLLPALALAAVQAAVLARFVRSSLLETLREDYVRTARAKGLGRHAPSGIHQGKRIKTRWQSKP